MRSSRIPIHDMRAGGKENINFTLIICTYKRPLSLFRLLTSVNLQSLYPDEILVIDASPDAETRNLLQKKPFKNLRYFQVDETGRGLTKQRNFGVEKASANAEIICFLDDDVILSESYFEELIGTYKKHPEALAASGYITNEVQWKQETLSETKLPGRFYYDGWSRVEGSRFGLRRKFGLAPDKEPGFMPDFSHGYSTGFLPPTGRIYRVEMLMGGLASYRAEVFAETSFSTYFEGYGLYEDADFSLRLSKRGRLYVNTGARLEHHHDQQGRPDLFQYGKMVLRNGWYVWKVKFPDPSFRAKVKWHSTAFLLTAIRFSNIFTSNNKKAALMETLGRISGWWSLIYDAPQLTDR